MTINGYKVTLKKDNIEYVLNILSSTRKALKFKLETFHKGYEIVNITKL